MTETENSFHASSSLCHSLSTVLAGEGWRTSLSATQDQMLSLGNRSGDHTCQVVHISTLGAGSLIRYRTQVGEERSPRSLQTRIRPSEYCTQNWNSSEKTTLYHFCIQFCHLAHQNGRLSLYCIVKGSRSNGRCADSLRCSKYTHFMTNGP
ncbi:hypothetical protein TNCV_3089251 [Trichonephila clavipes]|nr:hypothetical protein TNCV_3089251 [Trichonephila clavipes]